MSEFSFSGNIPASKSVLNRLLLMQSYNADLKISGDSKCDDVLQMKTALRSLKAKKEIFCGDAGTVFRFMALRASREAGTWILKGSPSLMRRPQEDLVFILQQLSVDCQLFENSLLISSQGWKKPLIPVQIHRGNSSQFASSLLLNSWNLNFKMEFEMKGHGLSEGYWDLSLSMAEKIGMIVEKRDRIFHISPGQKINAQIFQAEADYSSMFVVAAAAALGGQAQILKIPSETLQPDVIFIEILEMLGVPVVKKADELIVQKASEMKAIEVNLSSAPDLFPVLAVLCAFAKGDSKLFGAPQLALKESHRIQKTAELLRAAGIIVQPLPDGLVISGVSPKWKPKPFKFDPDNDHRMAMAAGLLKLKDYPIEVLNSPVVSKSFPEFWKILGRAP